MTVATAPQPVDDRRQPDDALPAWPKVIRSKVFYGREDDHFFAIDATFDIATQAGSEDDALASLVEMVCSYLNSCVEDGISYAEAQRPIPMRMRASLHARALLSRPLRAVLPSRGAHESEWLFPDFAHAHAHAVS